jgi:hypothetical protein
MAFEHQLDEMTDRRRTSAAMRGFFVKLRGRTAQAQRPAASTWMADLKMLPPSPFDRNQIPPTAVGGRVQILPTRKAFLNFVRAQRAGEVSGYFVGHFV